MSQAANALIGCLGGLKAHGTKECLLLQCLSAQEGASIALSYSTDVLENILRTQKEILEKQGFAVETRTVMGVEKKEISKIAKEEDYSIIVVGAEKDTLLRAQLFEGIAYDVISHSEKPVLLIRLEENYRDGQACIDSIGCGIDNHVLFPTDFSENAELAFDFLRKMVADGAKKITLLHVQDKAKIVPHLEGKLDEFNRIDTERLDNMKKVLEQYGNVEVNTIVRFGSPFVEILNFVKELNVQLVVMGSQGRGFVKELFLGSVSHNVARNSESSVLLIPTKREKE